MIQKPYSVLLTYAPSSCEDSDCVETFFSHVMASDTSEAKSKAREEMWKANHDADQPFIEDDAAEEYQCVLIISGHHMDINE
jgi:hypothetical protein